MKGGALILSYNGRDELVREFARKGDRESRERSIKCINIVERQKDVWQMKQKGLICHLIILYGSHNHILKFQKICHHID